MKKLVTAVLLLVQGCVASEEDVSTSTSEVATAEHTWEGDIPCWGGDDYDQQGVLVPECNGSGNVCSADENTADGNWNWRYCGSPNGQLCANTTPPGGNQYECPQGTPVTGFPALDPWGGGPLPNTGNGEPFTPPTRRRFIDGSIFEADVFGPD